MIAEKIVGQIEQLRIQVDGCFGSHEKTLLDYTWPSLGILDYYLYEMRNVDVFGEVEKQILKNLTKPRFLIVFKFKVIG